MEKWLKNLGIEEKNSGASFGANEWSTHKNSGEIHSINPANEKIIASVYRPSFEDYQKILQSSQSAFLRWKQVPAPKRGEIIRQIGLELRAAKSILGNLVSLESGKPKIESDGEVQEMIDMADFAVGQSRFLQGRTMASERPQHRMLEQWHPLGIVGVITAFNFPVAVWSWNAFLAAIAGDTVIWKPSSKTPLCAIAVQKICNRVFEANGFSGVFSLLITDETPLMNALADSPQISLISFTGSTATGRGIAERIARRLGKSLLELGGNNAIIVDEFANFALAIPAIVFGAVGTAGQRCTSTRRVIIHESLYQTLVEKLKNVYRQIQIGDPLDEKNIMGPLIDQAAVQNYLSALETIKKAGGEILYGGNILKGPGFFVQPTLVRAENHWEIVQKETFAPILYLITYRTLEEAIALHNSVPQGLSSAIFSDKLQHVEYFLSALGSDCGIANVNTGTSGAEIGGAFGGEKETGGGREAGSDAWKTYMRRQTNVINWGQDLPLAQDIQLIKYSSFEKEG